MRLACVQNGDFTHARRSLRAGGDETYFGQRYTVEAFARFVEGIPHQVVSLDAPPHREVDGNGEYLAVRAAKPRWFIPRRLVERARAARVIPELERFNPTHLLLRCNDVIGAELLSWAIKRRVRTAVIIAARFRPEHPPCRRFCELANDDLVEFVANHNRVAARSLVECGLRADKVVVWDYPPLGLTPEAFGVRRRSGAGGPMTLLFAGSLIAGKGVEDAIEAVRHLRRDGRDVRLVVCGVGPLLNRLRRHPGVRDGWLQCLGEVAHDEVVERMRGADAIVVPSRHEFPEALPCVITEGLALRTPLILSDHPVFREFFQERAGTLFFRAADPASLAATVRRLADDADGYAELSEKTEAVWRSLQVETKFHDVLDGLIARGRWNRDVVRT